MVRKTPILTVLFLGLAILATAAGKKKIPVVSVTDLRTEHLVSPMSIDTPTPRLGWRIESTESDVNGSASATVQPFAATAAAIGVSR